MPTQTRATLKGYFVKGSIPTADNFADLIDSTITQQDDGILTSATAPVSIKAVGADEGLINFYRIVGDTSETTWQIKQKPGGTAGLSIGTPTATRLFIDGTSGNVGIGTTNPVEPLDVNGRAKSGQLTVGPWPAGPTNYVFFGANTLDQAAAENYALLQGSTAEKGRTFLNSPVDIRFRILNRDRMVLANDGKVGIGTTTPAYGLDVKSKAIKLGLEENGGGQLIIANNPNDNRIWLEAYNATGDGHAAELLLTGRFGANVPRLSVNADQTWINGGIYAGNSEIYFTNIGHSHTGFGNAAGFAAIENANNFGCLMILGRAGTPNGRKVGLWDYLQVNGTFVNSSDAREKRDVTDLEYGLKEITQLRPVSFNWKDIANPHKSMGLVAQEVMPILGEAVYQDKKGRDDHLSIAYTSLIPVLINAVKELAAKVQQLSGEVTAKAG